MPQFHGSTTLWIAIGGVALLLLLAQRIRFLRALISFALTAALLGLLYLTVTQHARFDPAFSDIADKLGIDSQTVVGHEVRIRMGPDGHFWAHARIGTTERRMLIDSGATVTALSPDTASAAGLKIEQPLMPVQIRTANGMIQAQTTTIGELRLGDITARDLNAVVSPGFGGLDVLGMNFLTRLKSWRVEGKTLVLEPHQPQGDSSVATADNASG